MYALRKHALRILALFSLSAITTLGFAQGTNGDYERSSTIEPIYREAGRAAEALLVWTPEGDVIVRQFAKNGSRAFVRFDRTTGAQTPAFDHDQAAELLGIRFNQEFTADRLPIDLVFFSERSLLVSYRGVSFRVADHGTLEELPLEDTSFGKLSAAPTGATRSRDWPAGRVTMIFINRTSEPVTLDWIDREGKAHRYATLGAGAQHTQSTFAGHLWSVRSKEAGEWARYIARENPTIVAIDGEDRTLPPPPAEKQVTEDRNTDRRHPERRHVALIRDHNVWLRDTRTGEETPLTTDGHSGDRYTARFRWSPDSKHLATIREVPAQKHEVHIVETAPRDQVQPKLHTFHYLKPGDQIAAPRPVIISIEEKKVARVDSTHFPNPWSIGELAWSAGGNELTFLVDLRGHQRARWLAARPDGTTRIIIDEVSDTFLDYTQKRFLRTIRGGAEAIWMSERSGWNHLYRIEVATGKVLGSITTGEWLIRGVESVDDETETITFRAVGVLPDQDPYHVHYGRSNFDGTDLVWLTRGDGTHSIEFSPDGETYFDTFSRVETPPVVEWRNTEDGSLITTVTTGKLDTLEAVGWRPPERFAAKGRDGKTDIWGVIFTPSNFDPRMRYPVIEQIYAGPHGHFVPKEFSAWHGARALAELGFVVVQIDGMGTNWRSKAFHDVAWKNLGDSGFPDRIEWLRAAAATRPFMDLERVGIVGGSAGGQSALRALLAHGDFYDAAVSDCGCHDNRMDKIWWNEQWMGWPIGPHYAEQSNVTNAHKLEGDLLLIVGELDRNVDPASTMQVVDALIRADKDFDLLVIPGGGHGAGGSTYGTRRTHDFFVRKLWGAEPRRPE